jgi:hypothetical protein
MMPTWEESVRNTKVFPAVHRLLFNTKYLQGCRRCDKVVHIEGRFDGQLLGNCYQVLTTCAECGQGLVIDCHEIGLINLFLDYEN